MQFEPSCNSALPLNMQARDSSEAQDVTFRPMVRVTVDVLPLQVHATGFLEAGGVTARLTDRLMINVLPLQAHARDSSEA